jgi:hypothetical protein
VSFILPKISDTCGLKSGNAAKKSLNLKEVDSNSFFLKEGAEISVQNDMGKYSSCERIMSVQSLDLRYKSQ